MTHCYVGLCIVFILSLAVRQPSKFFVGGFSPRSIVSLPSPLPVQERQLGRFTLLLHAKSAKRKGRGGRRGTKTTTGIKEDDTQPNSSERPSVVAVPKPAKTKRVRISLERLPPAPPLEVTAYEVDDIAWWNLAQNVNPFGAKCWPSSLGVAQFLAQECGTQLDGRLVFELGCGTAVPSLVAAVCGATVVASDISTVVLSLVREGWLETSARRNQAGKDDTIEPRNSGSLSTLTFDLFSSVPLPLEHSSSNHTQPPIVIAAAMLYQADLAEGLARRLSEACAHHNAWVILGDDDTGEREGGREKFLKEFARIQGGNKPIRQVWTEVTVKNKSLGWVAKQVKLLHLNPPPGILPA
jgi:predicted nicotinamide N-methyase